MVRDGIFYALGMCIVAAILGWLAAPGWAVIPILFAVFFLWFFRDPERVAPDGRGLIVSPADGKVTDISSTQLNGRPCTRISIFLNVFNVHVNRTPMGGVIRSAKYQTGKFLNAMNPACADCNEQNTVKVEGDGHSIVFKQIAGLLARRIVFTKKVGDTVQLGERIGVMKFGSRMDVFLDPSASVCVKVGDHVQGGSSTLALLVAEPRAIAESVPAQAKQRLH